MLLAIATFASVSLFSLSATASDTTANTKEVNYQCDSNRSVSVTYGFNEEGHPTYASAKLDGKKRYMPLNFSHSDTVGATFGLIDSYTLGTAALSVSDYQKPMLITSPSQKILFKNCDPES